MFLVDEHILIDYPQLFEDLNNGKFRHLLCSLLGDILDGEDIYLLNYQNRTSPIKTNIKSKEQLSEKIKESNSFCYFNTSGTTGAAKVIKHKVSDLLEDVRLTKEKNVWLYTYNPFHMGGFQVFLQAVLNGNTLIYAYKKSRRFILDSLEKYNISHVSATPTFYKLLKPFEKKYFSVVRATLGGERANDSTLNFIKEIFPNAKINNIYALTETGAVLFSNGEFFKTNSKTKIIDNVLFAKDKKGNWNNTGDQVEKINNDTFYFIGRKSNIINIAGNNVNPAKVEDVLMQNPKIKNAIVYSKKSSSLGNLLTCDVATNETINVSDIRNYLFSSSLEYYEIPRIINLVSELKMSDNTKTIE